MHEVAIARCFSQYGGTCAHQCTLAAAVRLHSNSRDQLHPPRDCSSSCILAKKGECIQPTWETPSAWVWWPSEIVPLCSIWHLLNKAIPSRLEDTADLHNCCCLVAKSCPTLVTLWTVAYQVPLPMGFPRQKYWSGLPFPSPGDRPNLGIKVTSPALASGFFTTELHEKLWFI